MKTSKIHKPFYRLVTLNYPADKDGTGWRYIYIHIKYLKEDQDKNLEEDQDKNLEEDQDKNLEELRKIGIE